MGYSVVTFGLWARVERLTRLCGLKFNFTHWTIALTYWVNGALGALTAVSRPFLPSNQQTRPLRNPPFLLRWSHRWWKISSPKTPSIPWCSPFTITNPNPCWPCCKNTIIRKFRVNVGGQKYIMWYKKPPAKVCRHLILFHQSPAPKLGRWCAWKQYDGWGCAENLTGGKVVLFFLCCYPFSLSIYRTTTFLL